MKRGIKNILLSLVGFSAAPMLTACYGTPYDDMYVDDNYDAIGIEGYVVDTQMQPIKNIEVAANGVYDHTDANGHFILPISFGSNRVVVATDRDGEANGGEFGTQSVTVTPQTSKIVSIVMSKQE